jgi:arylsulfatase A-like enzyme
MPKLQAFVAGLGVSFTNSFVTNPVCCPSRASILRGQYTHNHGVWTNGRGNKTCFEGFKSAGFEASTIAAWLQGSGYRTGLFGKYLNHDPVLLGGADLTYIPPGWDEWFAIWDANYSSDAYFNYSANDNGKVVSFGSKATDYETDVLGAKAVDFIKRAQDGKPFCCG